MRRILEIAVAASATFALAAIGVLALQGFWLLRDCRQSVKAVGRVSESLQTQVEHLGTVTLPRTDAVVQRAGDLLQQASAVTRNLDRRISDTSQNLNAILIQSGLAADQIQQASREQKRYWEKISGDTDDTLKSLNAGAQGLGENMAELHGILAGFAGDPHWKDALAQTDGILADTHEMTSDAKKVVKRYSQPETKKQKAVNAVKQVGGLTYLILVLVKLLAPY